MKRFLNFNLTEKHPEAILLWMLFLLPVSNSIYLADYFTVIKKGLFLLCASIAAALLITKKTIVIPDLKGQFFLILLILGISRLVSVFLNFNAVSVRYFFESIGFLILSIFFQSILFDAKKAFLKGMRLPFCFGLVTILVHTVFQIYRCRWIELNLSTECFPSYFGNINMLEEYLILTIPFTIYFLRQTKNIFSNIFWGIIFSVTVFVIWQGQSRSTLIGLALLLIIYFYLKAFSRRNAIYLALSGLLICFSIFFIPVSKETFADKEGSTTNRLSLLKGSMQYLIEFPWGNGPGSFEYGYIPFQKFTDDKPEPAQVFLQPHNEFLRLGIESGWVFMGLVITLIVLIFIRIVKMHFDIEMRVLFLGLFVVIIPQIFFQFPLENGFSSYWLALCLGLFFSAMPVSRVSFQRKWRIFFFVPLVILFLFLSSSYLISNHLSFYFHDDLEKSQLACDLDPTNSNACANQIETKLNAKDYNGALKATKNELHKRPYNFMALKYLMIIHLETDMKKQACEAGYAYNQIFEARSDISDYLKFECSDFESPMKGTMSPETFRTSYLKWLGSVL